MTKSQYRKALSDLGLTIASKRTAALLGISPRQSQRYAGGEAISETIALLLRCYLAHGLPADIK